MEIKLISTIILGLFLLLLPPFDSRSQKPFVINYQVIDTPLPKIEIDSLSRSMYNEVMNLKSLKEKRLSEINELSLHNDQLNKENTHLKKQLNLIKECLETNQKDTIVISIM